MSCTVPSTEHRRASVLRSITHRDPHQTEAEHYNSKRIAPVHRLCRPQRRKTVFRYAQDDPVTIVRRQKIYWYAPQPQFWNTMESMMFSEGLKAHPPLVNDNHYEREMKRISYDFFNSSPEKKQLYEKFCKKPLQAHFNDDEILFSEKKRGGQLEEEVEQTFDSQFLPDLPTVTANAMQQNVPFPPVKVDLNGKGEIFPEEPPPHHPELPIEPPASLPDELPVDWLERSRRSPAGF